MTKIEVIRDEKGESRIIINDKDIKDIKKFESGQLIAAGALLCLTASFEDELSQINPEAKYGEIKASATYKLGKYDDSRFYVDHMDIEVDAKIPDKYINEHKMVVKRHEEHGCLWTRSLKKGFKVNFNFK